MYFHAYDVLHMHENAGNHILVYARVYDLYQACAQPVSTPLWHAACGVYRLHI